MPAGLLIERFRPFLLSKLVASFIDTYILLIQIQLATYFQAQLLVENMEEALLKASLSFLGWRPSLLGWRLSLLGWRPSPVVFVAKTDFNCRLEAITFRDLIVALLTQVPELRPPVAYGSDSRVQAVVDLLTRTF